jgi:hypothetical protein
LTDGGSALIAGILVLDHRIDIKRLQQRVGIVAGVGVKLHIHNLGHIHLISPCEVPLS